MSIALERITKRFGSYAALDEVSLTVRSGELVALLGPSGSGKTTLLRIIAGLEQPDAGDIRLNGEIATARSPRDREVGFVFQHYALFRHMTIFENVAFGLRVRPRGHRPPNAEIRERVQALLKLVQIERLAGRMPSQLSGGQRQRVALARALAIEPRVLLLDEPFGALDAKVRKELRRWLRGLHQEMRITSVFVTHDQEEALEVADRVVVMGQGRIEQAGAPEVVYNRPGNPFVYRFLGGANEIAAEVHHGTAYAPGVSIGAVTGNLADGKATLYVRPHDIELTPDPAARARIRFAAAVGPIARVEVELDPAGPPLEVEMPYDEFRGAGLSTGARVRVRARQAQTFQAPLA